MLMETGISWFRVMLDLSRSARAAEKVELGGLLGWLIRQNAGDEGGQAGAARTFGPETVEIDVKQSQNQIISVSRCPG
jgi:hypothetical protein